MIENNGHYNRLYDNACREIDILKKIDDKLDDAKCEAIKEACKIIGNYDIYNYIKELHDVGVLSHLTLKDDEFILNDDILQCKRNIRSTNIYKTKTGRILDEHPYNMVIRAKYNHSDKKQIKLQTENAIYKSSQPIYISKGGVITGEKITTCVIKKEYIDKHDYAVLKPINIPVSIINYKNESYFVVDHREPTLKLLQKKYEVYILIDETVKNYKFNLRNYKKLNSL